MTCSRLLYVGFHRNTRYFLHNITARFLSCRGTPFFRITSLLYRFLLLAHYIQQQPYRATNTSPRTRRSPPYSHTAAPVFARTCANNIYRLVLTALPHLLPDIDRTPHITLVLSSPRLRTTCASPLDAHCCARRAALVALDGGFAHASHALLPRATPGAPRASAGTRLFPLKHYGLTAVYRLFSTHTCASALTRSSFLSGFVTHLHCLHHCSPGLRRAFLWVCLRHVLLTVRTQFQTQATLAAAPL